MENVKVNMNTIRKTIVRVTFIIVTLSAFLWAKGTTDIYANQISARGVIMVPDIAAPEKPVIEKLVSSKTKTATVTYQKSSGASGYEISYATSKSGTYKLAGTTTSASYTISGLTKDKTYYVRVRAYKTVNGKKVYSSYSTVKSVKVI